MHKVPNMSLQVYFYLGFLGKMLFDLLHPCVLLCVWYMERKTLSFSYT